MSRSYNGTTNYNILHRILEADHEAPISQEEITKSYGCLKFLLEDNATGGGAVKRLINEKKLPTLDTPLHLATSLPLQAFSRLLLRHGAGRSLFITNVNGFTPGNSSELVITAKIGYMVNSLVVPTEALSSITASKQSLFAYVATFQWTKPRIMYPIFIAPKHN